MAVSDTTFDDLFVAVTEEIKTVPDGMSLSRKILDPKVAPNTKLNRLFSVEMQTNNTEDYRDQAGKRIRMEQMTTVRMAHRLNPKDEQATQRVAFVDESNVVVQMMTTERKPLCYTRVRYIQTRRTVLRPSREWLFTDVVFGIAFDFELAGEVT